MALYIHLPWCLRKCPYCDFNSHVSRQDLSFSQYRQALLADLEQERPLVAGRRISSVFIGGGTPSLFPPDEIAALLDGVCARLPATPDLEVSLEANPGTLEAANYHGYRAAGVTRLSIGVQSFDPGSLRALGRIHDRKQALAAAESACQVGFQRINLDLMFGLPGQTSEMALADVRQALALRPDHISYYQLTLEPNTPFYQAPPPLPPEEVIWEMQCQGEQELSAAGFRQYEISAFSRPAAQCRHNLNYWLFGDYIGIGAGAHGKITDLEQQCVLRRRRVRDPVRYLALAGTPGAVSGQRVLDQADLVLEFMLNVCRLKRGFSKGLFESRTGIAIAGVQPRLEQAFSRGLLSSSEEGRIRPTPLGHRYLNDLLALFLPEEP